MIPKFRAWHKTWEELGKVKRIRFDDEGNISTVFIQSETLGSNAYLKDIELMQSTGLHDKNGKEIFEGDIVRQVRTQPTTENETITGVVTMIEGAWLIMNDNKQLASYLWSETDENEVLGNIYENQGILEDEK
jgi:uncharacterized phage protein (TIGR01671 family)